MDAPISGGAAKAASGQMTMMTSARPAAYERANEVLDAMAGKVYRLGDRAGAGSKVKIVNQLLAGVHIAAAAEAMALGLREGVAPEALYEVITHSAGQQLDVREPHAPRAGSRLHALVGGRHLR
ncbi:MAG: 3-hydroxyisobutyrate dehydrogenase [Ramlibacter sp.]|nr:3-hydroxyisobutyrate dehydrogenase [Ramlibacter sp.]